MRKEIIVKIGSVRLDKFLSKELFSCTRGEIIRNIKNSFILVNGKEAKPSYILKENDNIKINLKSARKTLIPNKNIQLEIIYEDANIVAINKPADLKVHPVKFEEKNTLVSGLLSKFPEIKNISDGSVGSDLRPGIVHRLDQDTSGIIIAARNQKSFTELKKIFQERKIQKQYLALVYGKLKNKKGVINQPIAKSKSYKKQIIAHKKTRTKVRSALTEYEVKKEFKNYTLVKASPKTGRTHQIRIHFFHLGNPVVGDKKYKLKKNSQLIQPDRQLLHAQSLSFELFGRKYNFQVKIPQDFEHFLTKLQ